MKNILKLIHKENLYKQIASNLASGKECHVQGLWGSSAAFLVACMASDRKLSRKGELLFVTSGIEEAEEVFEDINIFLDQSAIVFPVSEDAISVGSQPDNAAHVQQTSILFNLIISNDEFTNRIIIAPIQSLLQHVPPPEILENNILTINIGQEYEQEFILNWLLNGSFVRTGTVELPGEFSLRGGIIDIFPFSSMQEDQASNATDSNSACAGMPYRIEFFGDEVDSIRVFNTETQLSEKKVNSCKILGVQTEHTYTHPNQKANKQKGKFNSLIDYIPRNSWIVFKEYNNIENKAKEIYDSLQSYDKIFPFKHLIKSCKDFTKIYLSNLSLKRRNVFSFNIKALGHFDHDVDKSIKKIEEVRSSYSNTIIFCSNQAEEQRLSELLSSDNSPLHHSHKTKLSKAQKKMDKHSSPSNIKYQIGHLNHGFLFEDISTAFLTHHEIFLRYRLSREP